MMCVGVLGVCVLVCWCARFVDPNELSQHPPFLEFFVGVDPDELSEYPPSGEPFVGIDSHPQL